MARFLPLNVRGARLDFLAAAGLSVLAMLIVLAAPARAQAPMQAAPPPPPAAKAPPTPAGAPATNAAAAHPPLPKPVQNTLSRYGNIVLPGDAVQYPLKLKLPFPGVGEVKVPKPDELVMRQKLEELARLSDDDIRKQLAQWPAFSRMSCETRGARCCSASRISAITAPATPCRRRTTWACSRSRPTSARSSSANSGTSGCRWTRSWPSSSLPVFQAREQKLEADLFREFSSATPGPAAPAVPAPRPPAPPVNHPPQPPAPPVARNNPPGAPTIGQSQQ
ncbi:MAG: hypothetical protein WDO13_00375 [Verrucomicrobiota bacterium]